MDDLRQQVKSQENFLEKLTRWIPGFAGYKDREQRRTADQILRTHLADQLAGARGHLAEAARALLASGALDGVAEIDRVGGRLERVTDRLRHATYGYSGFFDAVKIGTPQLDQLYDSDARLAAQVTAVRDAAAGFAAAVSSAQDWRPLLAALESNSADLDEALNARSAMLKGVK